MENYKAVIYLDECYVHIGGNKGAIYITRQPHKPYIPECTVPTFSQSSVRVMVWGAIMWDRKGPLLVLDYPGGRGGGMNSIRYREQVLDGALLQFYTEMDQESDGLQFLQDNARCHTSKSLKKWFQDHGISLFPHPPSSPDLNPIEPVWHELKRIIARCEHPPTTVDELKQAILDAWEELDMEDINKYVRSMPDRVATVLEAKGRGN